MIRALSRPQAMQDTFDQARAFFLAGVQHYAAQRFAQAEAQFAASLSLVPNRPSTLTNLGATRLKLGRFEEAAQDLAQALAQEPDNVEALGHYGTALAELGRHREALAAFDRVVTLAPALGTAWSLRGSVLRDLGQLSEAAHSFEQALTHGADPELTRYYLASVRGGDVPTEAPQAYVEALFDTYAPEFDAHVQRLAYRAPEVLLGRLAGRHFARVLDLGCGTGLCGRLLRGQGDAIDGVDLSGRMIERAQATGAYADLVQSDLAAYLRDTPHRYDLVIAADVFIYVGALQGVFAGVARVLQPGGVFCFSVEESTGPDLALRSSLRYAHSEASLRRLAAAHGLRVDAIERGTLREEQREPIAGLYAWLAKP